MFERYCKIDDSSQIDHIWYDLDELVMRVRFSNGEDYDYLNVPAGMFGQIVSSPSVGIAFHKLVRQNSAIKFVKIGFR